MIIGETFNNEYDRYEEDSYDYLFKRKSKEERQQKKAERKEKRAERKEAKRDPATGEKKKLQIFKNFGLFDKNKNKNKTAGSTTTPGSSSKTGEPGSSTSSTSSDESKLTPEAKAAAAEAGAADKTDSGTTSGSESGSGADAGKDGSGSPKKEAGFGPLLGFAFLGITILIAGIAIYKADKKPISELQPLRAAA